MTSNKIEDLKEFLLSMEALMKRERIAMLKFRSEKLRVQLFEAEQALRKEENSKLEWL